MLSLPRQSWKLYKAQHILIVALMYMAIPRAHDAKLPLNYIIPSVHSN